MTDVATKFINMLQANQELGFDVETGGTSPKDGSTLDWKRGYICGYSLSDGIDAFYVPVRHGGGANIVNVELFEKTVNAIIQTRTKPLIGHNIKFDYHFCLNHGIKLGKLIKDTMVREALINENRNRYDLESVCKHYPVAPKKGKLLYIHLAEKFGCKPTRESMGYYYMLAGDDALGTEYGAGDTLTTYQLWAEQNKEIDRQELHQIDALEGRLTYVLAKMERRGVRVDLEELQTVRHEADELHMEAYSQLPLRGDLLPINPKSARDLKEYFELCEIDDWPMTAPTDRFPEGQASFTKDYLTTHQEGFYILEARKYDHFKSMFLESFMSFVHGDTIHCRFNQAKGEFGGAKPGRMSCADPNMQFVPKRDKQLGKLFRKIFIPRKGKKFGELDYSQAEPRLFTHYSNEPTLIKGYTSTPVIDMHQVAADMMHITRDVAKNLNLGIMYTMGAEKLAAKLNISIAEAKAIVKLWHQTFRYVSTFTKRAAERAEQRGYVMTILGRRARFPDPRWAYRSANRIIQGGSADILKYKMVEIDDYLESMGLEDEMSMLLSIHDSLVFEMNEDRDDQLMRDVARIMENVQCEPFNLRVPFVADFKPAGRNWSEATYGLANAA